MVSEPIQLSRSSAAECLGSLYGKVVLDNECIETGRVKEADGVLDGVHNRFAHDVETRVQQHRDTGQLFKRRGRFGSSLDLGPSGARALPFPGIPG
jgi:hypothetical protein